MTERTFFITKKRLREMTNEALEYGRRDASEAAEMAESLERNGYAVLKSGGYYRDEASAYGAELRRRGSRPMSVSATLGGRKRYYTLSPYVSTDGSGYVRGTRDDGRTFSEPANDPRSWAYGFLSAVRLTGDDGEILETDRRS
jgi:hypothetical protein